MAWATSADVPLPDFCGPPASDADDQAAATLLKTRALTSACSRLGVEALPAFAWRFARLGDGIAGLVDDLFGGDK